MKVSQPPASTFFTSILPHQPLKRQTLLILLNTALAVGEWRYARAVSQAWLAAFPSDLTVQWLLAKAHLADDQTANAWPNYRRALEILEKLIATDPEQEGAYILLAAAQQKLNLDPTLALSCAHALSQASSLLVSQGLQAPPWVDALRQAQKILKNPAALSEADKQSDFKRLMAVVLAQAQNLPLAAVTHLRLTASQKNLPPQAVHNLAKAYHQHWPACVQFLLILAEYTMSNGDAEQAVPLLHQAVVRDCVGQVAERLWGSNHPYRNLWPQMLEIPPGNPTSPQCIPVPAAIAATLGWNLLPPVSTLETASRPIEMAPANPEIPSPANTVPTEKSRRKNHPVRLSSASTESNSQQPSALNQPPQKTKADSPQVGGRSELEQIARRLKQPHLARLDGRFPVYVIFTTRTGLQNQYGTAAAAIIDEQLKRLARAVRGHRNGHETWGSILMYADDPTYASAYGLQAARHNDPWSLKLFLSGLDEALGKQGERIGAVLLVGGPEVIPFHHLPNPLDDADPEVPSDNPYATRNGNYYLPEWPVGRLPGGADQDPTALLNLLRAITERHICQQRSRPFYQRWWEQLCQWIKQHIGSTPRLQASFGYTAAIWRRASLSVFRAIGDPGRLLISPPTQVCEIEPGPNSLPRQAEGQNIACLSVPATRLGYFNLHGLADAAEWYGQRDPLEPGGGPDFPVALRPQDIRNGGHAPQVVFSEACYGAHILGKNIEQALSLKFLVSGSQTVIGSTCISYGSVGTPLMAADLLGRVFWNGLNEGLPVGEALRRAKLHLAQEMHRRQGYLDGEDQKTIISFVLYGDPLALPIPKRLGPKSVLPPVQLSSSIRRTCERGVSAEIALAVPTETLKKVQQIVAHSLPGMENAEIRLQKEWTAAKKTCLDCRCGGICPTTQADEANAPRPTGREVLILRKTTKQANLSHQQVARLTLDQQGKVVKMVVSR